ncbi:MAG: ABC transporter permease subunit [Thermotogae bacterium]|nr:ABC transporter permease subunit [Thermotogota bacterium]HOO75867.1 ABC transporter permease subunit [Tepiditoga sp.]
MIYDLLKATLETLYMTFFSGVLSVALGIPLGILLYLSSKSEKKHLKIIYSVTDFIVNTFRSIPFIILIILLIPLTKFLLGTIIGSNAAVVSLTIAAVPFMARLSENSFNKVSDNLIDVSESMGMTTFQFVFKILLPETLPETVSDITVLFINLITFTAIAGAVGAGGLGQMAINYGYYKFQIDVLLYDVIILICITQIIQFSGKKISDLLKK